MATYAVIETGGKQYRVEKGSTLLVDRLSAGEGDTVDLRPVAYRDVETGGARRAAELIAPLLEGGRR